MCIHTTVAGDGIEPPITRDMNPTSLPRLVPAMEFNSNLSFRIQSFPESFFDKKTTPLKHLKNRSK